MSERLREFAVNAYLSGQRFNWPLPPFVRGFVRDVLAKTIDQSVPGRPDDWPNPLAPGIRDDGDKTIRVKYNDPHQGSGVRLRCVVVTQTLNLGGSEIVALFLARGLPAHGLDTIVAYAPSADPGKPAGSLCLDGIQIVELSPRDVSQWLDARRPDIISMHSPPDWFVAAAAEAGIPSIETIHGAHSFFDEGSWPREQLRSQQITGFIAVSEALRRHYLRANPIYPPHRVVTIPNGVDGRHIGHRDRAQARAWLGLREEFVFVSLARYALQKNTFGLVTAFAEVASVCPEAHLLLAGSVAEPGYFEQVRRLRDGLSCASQIHLHGPCPDVSTVLAAADAFVLDPYFEAGFPLASMEALCAGLPVVISDVAGAREQMGEDGSRGFVVGNPLGDPEAVNWHRMGRERFRPQINRSALVEAMCAIVRDRDHWRDTRAKLRSEAWMQFSPELWLRRYAEVLTRAAAAGTVPSPGNRPRLVACRWPNPDDSLEAASNSTVASRR
jgi:glycosyltransferase involved in cell wall biosynthesis